MTTVVIVSADAEWNALTPLFPGSKFEETPFGKVFHADLESWNLIFFQGGWGKVSAAASTQYIIDHLQPNLIINLGTCGGIQGRIDKGAIILVDKTIIYDIVEQMTDPEQAIEQFATSLDLSWLPRIMPSRVYRGLLVSGDRDILIEDIPMLIKKYGAVAADWESGSIAWVAKRNGKRLLILRGVSDLVGGEGAEAYGNYELFLSRTKEIMRGLIDVLPKWLMGIENFDHGFRV